MRLPSCNVRLLIGVSALAATLLGDAALSQSHPKRQPGLWEIQSVASQRAGLKPYSQCVGPTTDSPQMHLDRLPGKRGVCNSSRFERRGNAWVAESVCRRGRNVVTTRKIATGDFSSAYRIDTIVRHRVGKTRKPQVRDVLVARYLGNCRPGQRPDDLMTPGMGSLNMSDGEFTAEPRKRPGKRRK